MAKRITDLSFAESIITIDGIVVQDFIDDKNPLDVQDATTCNIEWSCNGKMIRTIKPEAVMLSVTVIPGSPSDTALQRLWRRCMCNGGHVSLGRANDGITCSINPRNPNVPSYSFVHGTCVAGAAAVSVNGQGKMGGNTYTFAFEGIS